MSPKSIPSHSFTPRAKGGNFPEVDSSPDAPGRHLLISQPSGLGLCQPCDLTIASVGTSASIERALACHTRGNTAPYPGVGFVNNAGPILNVFTLPCTPKQRKMAPIRAGRSASSVIPTAALG